MKKIIFNSVLLVIAFMITSKISGQQTKISKFNYVVLTTNVEQLQPIILTAQALKSEQGSLFGDFQVIVCGKNIGDITDPQKMDLFLSKADEAGVTMVACGFSLTKFKVDKTKIHGKIVTVENGILHNFQLQNKGYKSLSL